MLTRLSFILTLLALPVLSAEPGKHIVFLVGDPEYKTGETVPAWARQHIEPAGIRCTFLVDGVSQPFDMPGLKVLESADALFISIKRRGLPPAQMKWIRDFAESGKPVIGIRTSSHAFEPKKPAAAPGEAVWPEFDRQIFGGHYLGHYGKGPLTLVQFSKDGANHPILKGITTESIAKFESHLYQCRDLGKDTMVLLNGTVDGKPEINEPVAWLNLAPSRRTFYTSLGAPEDFESEGFRLFLKNATLWMLGKLPRQ